MKYKCWSDKCVVYHSDAGDVHLMTSNHVRLLELIQSNYNTEQIRAEYIKHPDFNRQFASKTEFIEWIDKATKEFEKLKLLN